MIRLIPKYPLVVSSYDLRITSVTSCFGASNCTASFKSSFMSELDSMSLTRLDNNETVFSLTGRLASPSVFSASAVFIATFVRMPPNEVSRPSSSGAVRASDAVILACTSLHASDVAIHRFGSNDFVRQSKLGLLRSRAASMIGFTELVNRGLWLRPTTFSCLRLSL